MLPGSRRRRGGKGLPPTGHDGCSGFASRDIRPGTRRGARSPYGAWVSRGRRNRGQTGSSTPLDCPSPDQAPGRQGARDSSDRSERLRPNLPPRALVSRLIVGTAAPVSGPGRTVGCSCSPAGAMPVAGEPPRGIRVASGSSLPSQPQCGPCRRHLNGPRGAVAATPHVTYPCSTPLGEIPGVGSRLQAVPRGTTGDAVSTREVFGLSSLDGSAARAGRIRRRRSLRRPAVGSPADTRCLATRFP